MDIKTRLYMAQVSSCSCMTKTPVHEAHTEDCLYRVLQEAIETIDGLEKLNDAKTNLTRDTLQNLAACELTKINESEIRKETMQRALQECKKVESSLYMNTAAWSGARDCINALTVKLEEYNESV